VALAAIRSEMTLVELAEQFKVHSNPDRAVAAGPAAPAGQPPKKPEVPSDCVGPLPSGAGTALLDDPWVWGHSVAAQACIAQRAEAA